MHLLYGLRSSFTSALWKEFLVHVTAGNCYLTYDRKTGRYSEALYHTNESDDKR